MDKLKTAVDKLPKWQADNLYPKGRCLEATRFMLGKVGLKLPLSRIDYPTNFAIDNFHVLRKEPAGWGWKRAVRDADRNLPDYCLVYFKLSGWSWKYKKFLGHIGILHKRVIYSNINYRMTKWWGIRLVGGFVLLED